MGKVLEFKKSLDKSDEILNFFFSELNREHGTCLALSHSRISPHLLALRVLADVFLKMAPQVKAHEITKNRPDFIEVSSKQLDLLRTKFFVESVLGILEKEGLVVIARGEG